MSLAWIVDRPGSAPRLLAALVTRTLSLRWIALRIGSAAITMLGASIFVFTVMHLVPGSFEDIFLGVDATPAERAALAAQYGLDRPLPQQYLSWVSAVASGDFGVSLSTGRTVRDEFLRRAPITAQLAVMALAISILIGVSAGAAAAFGARSKLGAGLGRMIGLAGLSLPSFVLGSILLFVFSTYSLGLTVGGFVPFFDDPIGNLRSMILPAFALGFPGAALLTRTTRDAVLSVLAEPYVVAAVARGVAPVAITLRHVVRNAAIAPLTVIALEFGGLLGGSLIVEQLFSIPGFGIYVLSAVAARDYAVVQAGVLIAAAAFITIHMLADLAYAWIDPRIVSARTEKA